MPAVAFEQRFFAPTPPRTNAQEAATRVYNRGGILVRSDPFIAASDRNGRPFTATKWHAEDEPPPRAAKAAPAPRVTPRAAPRAEDPVALFRRKILGAGGSGGIHSLGRVFRIMDADGNRRISVEELREGMLQFGMTLTEEDASALIRRLDSTGAGRLTFNDFMVAIRGDINPRRKALIQMAYETLDRTGDGKITIADIEAVYSAAHDPDVMAGRLAPEDALMNFLSMFDTVTRDGVVTMEEFTEYYKNVSASIDNDDYFELMLRNAWHIPGGEGMCGNTSNHRILVVHNNGSQEVVMIKKDLGLRFDDYAAVLAELEAEGCRDIAKWTLGMDV